MSGNSILSLYSSFLVYLVEYDCLRIQIPGWGCKEIAAKALRGKNSTGSSIFSAQ